MENPGVQWHLRGVHHMVCNCNYGCPCAFNAPPTYGSCEGVVAFRVEAGRYGEIPLDGLSWMGVVSWPGAIHERNGKGVFFLDGGLSDEQRRAVEALATGRAGGPWSILAGTLTAGVEIREGRITYDASGPRTRIAVDDAVDIEFDSIKNPVTGADHRASTLLPTGILTNQQDHYSAKVHRVRVNGMAWEYPGRTAAEMAIQWTGP